MTDELEIVREGLTAEHAESLKRLLASRDVEAYVAPSDSVRGEWNLLTAPEQANRATRFLELADEENDLSDPEMVLDDRDWLQWPRCQTCDWRRTTRCRFCGSTGNDFPVADGAPVSEFAPVLLLCSTCDEPFEPEFLDHCERCNEPFEDGIAFPSTVRRTSQAGNPRVGMAALAMVVIVLLLFVYWWWIS